MKKSIIILLLGIILVPAGLNTQNDWANYLSSGAVINP